MISPPRLQASTSAALKRRVILLFIVNFLLRVLGVLRGLSFVFTVGQLEADHISPLALGGKHAKTNLGILCRTHNQWMARK